MLLLLAMIGQLLLGLAVPTMPVATAAEQQYMVYTSKDSFVRKTNPSSPVPDYSSMPYGGESAKTGFLNVKEINTTSPREAYLQFDLSDYPEQISSATLYFHANNGESNTATVAANVYGIQSSAGNVWEESTLTWNNRPDKESGLIGTVTIPGGSNKGWVSLDVTSFIQDRQAEDKIASFAVAGSNALIRIESSTTYINDSSGKQAKPYLVLQGTPALKSVELTADKTSLGLSQTANLSVTGTMDTNSPADLTGASFHYSSDDPAIVFSNPSTGTATAAGEGSAQVTVEVTLDGATRTAVRTLTVDGTPPAEVADIQGGLVNGDFTLTWTDPSDDDLENVSVYSGDELLGTVPKGIQTLVLTGLIDGQHYSLTFRTRDAAGNESAGMVQSIAYEQPNVLTEVTASASEQAVRTGQTVTVTVSGFMSDGSAADLEEATIVYESSSESLAFADSSSNIADAVLAGPAYVTAQVTLDGVTRQSAPMLVRVLGEESDEFDRLRNKYAAKFTGYDPEDPYDLSDPYINSYIQSQDELAEGYWHSLNKTNYGWDDLTSSTVTAQLSTLTSRLRTMSRQWASYGSDYYQNELLLHDIIETWNTFYETRYNESMAKFGNWFDLQVHVPNNFHDSISAIYEAVPFSDHPDVIEKMHRAVDHFVPSVGLTGANRVYLSKVIILRGILGKDGDKIQEGSDGLSAVFEYVKDGDGFYEDGSFIQHSYFPYAGGYGKALLHDISETLWLVGGSQWENDDPLKANIFEWFADSFEPNMFDGHLIDAVNGREASRTSVYSGNTVLGGLLLQLELDGNSNAETLKSSIVYHLEQGNASMFMASSPIWYIQKAKQLMNDAAIQPFAEPQGNFLFHNQDNVVQRGPNWLYSIGMHSERMANFESISNENLKGWYQGDGMTQLYLDPLDYLSLFWITVDPHRLPGITVDRDESRPPATAANRPYVDISKYQGDGELMENSWTGGVSLDGLYGTAGMDFKQHHYSNMDVSARKSWFMFDDEIVALGAGINSTSSRGIETIVENRVLNSQGDNALTVNGDANLAPGGQQEQLESAEWMHLEGTGGYVFPGGADVRMLREERAGKSQDINEKFYYRGNDSFNSAIRSPFWSLTREAASNYSFTGSSFNITTQQGSLIGPANNTNNLLQTAAPIEDFYASTALAFNPAEQGQEAGLILRRDDDNFVYLSVGTNAEDKRLFAVNEIEGVTTVVDYPAPAGENVYLKIDKSGGRYDLFASADGENWGEALHTFQNPMAGEDRMNDGLKMGLFAQNGLEQLAGITASFDEFQLLHTRNYMTVWFDHGVDPVDEAYEYILLPKKAREEVADYHANPDVAVLSNTKQIQAVRESQLGITAINFWERGSYGDVKANQPSSVMMQESGNQLKLAVSDPTQKKERISFEIKRTGTEVLSKDAAVTVLQLSPTIRFEVDASLDPGATHQVSFAFDEQAEVVGFDEPKLHSIHFEDAYLAADVNETAKSELTALMDDNGIAEEGDYSVYYSSSNDAVAIVGADGTITAVSAGTATITAVATLDGITEFADLDILVTTAEPSTTQVYPVMDTYVRGGIYENDAFGSDAELTVKNGGAEDFREAYFSFDLGAVTGEIESVRFNAAGKIGETSGTFVDTVLRSIESNWSASDTTFKNKPELGDVVSAPSRYTVPLSTQSFDITEYVKDQLKTSSTIDFALVQDVLVGRRLSVYSMEDATRKPYLEIVVHSMGDGVVRDSVITPLETDYDKYSGSEQHKDIEVSVSLMGNHLVAIRNGSETLTEGADYTAAGNRYTLKKEYLAGMDEGTLELTFAFSAGADRQMFIRIADTSPPQQGGGTEQPPVATPPANELYPTQDGVAIKAGGAVTTTVDGKTTSRYAVSDDILGKAIELLASGQERTLTIEHDGEASEWITEWSASALELLRDAGSQSVIAVRTGSAAYRLPIAAIDLEAIAVALQSDMDNIKLSIAIRVIDGAELKSMEEEALGEDIRLVGSPIAFTVTAEAGGDRYAVEDFGGVYVSRLIYLQDPVDPVKAAGFLYRPGRGLSFVPMIIGESNGKATAELKRSGNSIYLIGESVRTFADMQQHWAKDEVETMASKLIVNGIGEERFAPERNVTRAEFTAMLVRGLGLTVHGYEDSYSDVAASDWFTEAVGTAAHVGLIQGYEDGTFGPDDTMTREQMAVMLIRALSFAGSHAKASTSGLTVDAERTLAAFSDGNSIANWSRSAVAEAVNQALMQGVSETRFAPESLATRAQAAVVLARLLRQLAFINA